MDIHSVLAKFIQASIKKALQGTHVGCEEIILLAPKLKEHGDISTNIAMRLAGLMRMRPLDIAEKITAQMQKCIVDTSLRGKIAKISVKEPGFINFFLTNFALVDSLEKIQADREKYGSCNSGKGKMVLIEFVSANPTGPLSVAHGRQAAVGDSLVNILRFSGWQATSEYFINDEGRQINMLGESIRLRYLEKLGQTIDFPQDGYKGRYIYDMAQDIIKRYGKKYASPTKATIDFFRGYGCEHIMNIIKGELKDFDVHFDVWTSQARLVRAKKIEKVFAKLKKKGFLYEHEGALWFKSTAFGDDKDRVVIKSDGSYTYLAPDIAYHLDKFKRGFDKLINIWGPDHHGYIPRLKAAVQALGYPKEVIDVLIVQLATLYRGKEQVPMSTRSGEFITLRQVMEDVGKDAARFFFVARKASSHLDFDIELAKKQSQENPVYYVQYAHARCSNIIEFAKKSELHKGFFRADAKKASLLKILKPDLKLLEQPQELELMKALSQFPDAIMSSAVSFEPCAIVTYLQGLADAFHSFYDKHRVVVEDMELTKARLVLADSTRIVIANGLNLLGVCAPTKM